MAKKKTTSTDAALIHALAYTLPFFLLTLSPLALIAICATHFVIDRFRLARYVCWIKNGAGFDLTATGYPADTPPWQAVWLLIITDNVCHVAINGAALRWL